MFEIGLEHFLILAALVFIIGVFGLFLNRKNVIVMLMCVELMLLAVNINFVAFSSYLNDVAGQVFAMFILVIVAAQIVIGLGILVVFFRNKGNIDIEEISSMKG